jgi:hypothetical protein
MAIMNSRTDHWRIFINFNNKGAAFDFSVKALTLINFRDARLLRQR